MHENLSRRHAVRSASPRAFGIMVAAVLMLVALQPLLSRGAPRWVLLGFAAAALVVALVAAPVYAIPNRAWMWLGGQLARVTSPVALIILFYGVFTPIGWLMRVAGRDPLRLARDSETRTYWIDRSPPGPDGASLKNTF
jgi:hypothetical protein